MMVPAAEEYRAKLSAAFSESRLPAAIFCFASLGSTMDAARAWTAGEHPEIFRNALLERSAPSGSGAAFFLSAEQRQGRGREGRSWYSPPLSGVFMTAALPALLLPSPPVGLPLVIAVAVGRMLDAQGVQARFKWPNDVLAAAPVGGLLKIAGILVESSSSGADFGPILAGIGLNVHYPAFPADVPGVSIAQLSPEAADYYTAAAALCNALWTVLEEYRRNGFAGFKQQWQDRCLYLNEMVEVETPQGERIAGLLRGVADDGSLLLLPPGAPERPVYSVRSLRPIVSRAPVSGTA